MYVCLGTQEDADLEKWLKYSTTDIFHRYALVMPCSVHLNGFNVKRGRCRRKEMATDWANRMGKEYGKRRKKR